MAKPKPKATAPKPGGERAMTDQREKQKRGRSGQGPDEGRGTTDRREHRKAAGTAAPRDQRLKRRRQLPQIGGADIFSAGAFRRLSLDGATFGLTPAPTKRVHDPSGVATHGVALGSAGDSPFRSARVVMMLCG